ncbi:DUF4358 domain-containing protein [Ihubacter sp. rT4E-8]|uniref:DUF4358 domain-containing protein n=1 Tax=unclassified Ihubacter TaxID=2633299 RepID=UPI003C797F7E
MRKKIMTVSLAVLLLLIFAVGCGGDENAEGLCRKAAEAALEKVGEDTELDTTVAYGEETYGDNFERLYNFSMDKAADGVIVYSGSGSAADEISLICAKESGDVGEIKKYLEARRQQRLHDFQSYMPEEANKIENARVVVMKQYVFLIISDQADEIEIAIKEVLG